jgi:hypothetical protein
MRYKEFISELFEPNQASELEWEKAPGATYAMGVVPINDTEVNIDITFSEIDDDIVDIEFMVGGEFDLTGRGGVSQVFATVIEAVKIFVKNNPKITTITFTAHEQSRAKMYDTVAKRVSKQVGWHVVPYDEMISNPKFHARSGGEFTFAIQKGSAPAHRQAAQAPQHGGFVPVFYVYAYENDQLPAIQIKAKKSMDAEMWVIKNIPGYNKEDPMSIFASKTPPKGRKIIDKGSVPPKPPQPKQDPNSLGAQLRAKLDTPK